jgi:hypothetical protein
MRRLTPLRLAVLGLALAVPAVARADDPPQAPVGTPTAPAATQPNPAAAPKPRGHWLRKPRMCPQCQYKAALAAGLPVPPPPPPVVGSSTAVCTACYGQGHPAGMAAAPTAATGYAAVGGDGSEGMMAGPEPAPIGVVQTSFGPAMGAGPAMPGAPGYAAVGGGYNPAAGGPVPPPSEPFVGHSHDRPHILTHMLFMRNNGGLFGAIAARKRDAHAAIRYDSPENTVTELPSSMVFSRR